VSRDYGGEAVFPRLGTQCTNYFHYIGSVAGGSPGRELIAKPHLLLAERQKGGIGRPPAEDPGWTPTLPVGSRQVLFTQGTQFQGHACNPFL